MSESREQLSPQPFFEGGKFEIVAFSNSKEGFNIQSHSRRRTLTPAMRKAMWPHRQNEVTYRQIHKLPFVPRVVLRDVHQEGNTLIVNTEPASFTTIKAQQDVQKFPKKSPELEQAMFTGIGGIVQTDEGAGKIGRLIFQKRSEKNRPWGGVPGASWGAYFGGSLVRDDSSKRGMLREFSEKDVIAEGNNVARHELGIDGGNIIESSIIGLARMNTTKHHHYQFIQFSKVNQSYEELASHRHSPDSSQYFEEKFSSIPATTTAIETLLTKVETPLPHAHAASFIAVGYLFELERKGKTRADHWKARMERKMRSYYAKIDRKVRGSAPIFSIFGQKQTPGERDYSEYDPYFTPQAQGLVPQEQALMRLRI